jgi:signal transduction histidine kinase
MKKIIYFILLIIVQNGYCQYNSSRSIDRFILVSKNAIDIYKNANNINGLNAYYYTLCCQFINSNNYDDALQYINKAIGINQYLKSKIQQNYNESKLILNTLDTIFHAQKEMYLKDELDIIEVPISIEKGLGTIRKAFQLSKKHIKKHIIYIEKIDTREIIKNQATFEAKRKELEVDKLYEEAQKSKSAIVEAQNQKKYLIILVFIFTFLMLLFIHLSRKIHEKNKTLKEQNIKIELTKSEIEKSNKTIRKAISIVAHDLRGPFNTLLGYSNYIIENFESLEKEELKEYLETINTTANNNFKFTQQLLNWSMKQQYGFVINKEIINANSIIINAISNLNVLATQKNIVINTELTSSEKCNGLFDKDIIFNIVYNIILNAIKYSKENGIININSFIDNNYFKVEVIDFGYGMDSNKVIKLNTEEISDEFNFKKMNNEYNGGYGLVYSKELISIYGGKIFFKSILNVGTTVDVFFPLQN